MVVADLPSYPGRLPVPTSSTATTIRRTTVVTTRVVVESPALMAPLQMFGIDPLRSLMLALVVPLVIVVLGTYVGVLMALQSFFGGSSWQDVSTVAEE
jgi:hypothetical protein